MPADQEAVEFLQVHAMQRTGAYLGRGPWDDDVYAVEETYLQRLGLGQIILSELEARARALGYTPPHLIPALHRWLPEGSTRRTAFARSAEQRLMASK
jgi:hypothetical protein